MKSIKYHNSKVFYKPCQTTAYDFTGYFNKRIAVVADAGFRAVPGQVRGEGRLLVFEASYFLLFVLFA